MHKYIRTWVGTFIIGQTDNKGGFYFKGLFFINKRVPLVLTYHPSLQKISGIVRHHWKEIEKSETLTKLFPEPPVLAFRRPKALRIHWSELRYLDLHRRSASVNHVVTNVKSAVSNCNTHKCSIARRQERSIRSFAMSIAKHLMWFTPLNVTSAGRNTREKVSNHSTKEWMDTEVTLQKKTLLPVGQHFV